RSASLTALSSVLAYRVPYDYASPARVSGPGQMPQPQVERYQGLVRFTRGTSLSEGDAPEAFRPRVFEGFKTGWSGVVDEAVEDGIGVDRVARAASPARSSARRSASVPGTASPPERAPGRSSPAAPSAA